MRCLALAVLRQHVAVALSSGIVALVKTKAVTTFYFFLTCQLRKKVRTCLTFVALLTSLSRISETGTPLADVVVRACAAVRRRRGVVRPTSCTRRTRRRALPPPPLAGARTPTTSTSCGSRCCRWPTTKTCATRCLSRPPSPSRPPPPPPPGAASCRPLSSADQPRHRSHHHSTLLRLSLRLSPSERACAGP